MTLNKGNEMVYRTAEQRVQIKLQTVDDDADADSAVMRAAIEGRTMGYLRLPFETANSVEFFNQIEVVLRKTYELGRRDGEQLGKDKLNDLIQWARD
jgi:hypothetical protein